ncbi:MAG: tRNA (adenosine(37)-N6)-dimethylallyltransferase MiaA [Halieaceae bacterium]|nr:tRNA (adenosine(37)-N6)-dimethylallyltransferase MiaA [Halieaceae bacterium]
MRKPPIVFLMGPTAAGKTQMAIDLAGRVDCELISVDSAQVYRGLDIGTAKPSFPHHLISIRDPVETYSAVEFAQDAANICFEICNRGKTPVLVGGSMLYFRILLEGFSNIPPMDPSIRRELEIEGINKGWSRLHARLSTLDPISASKIHPNHSRRISRALEVYYSTGKPLSEWHREDRKTTHFADKFEIYRFAITPNDRSVLHKRIEWRFSSMMEEGFLDEVNSLFERGDLNESLPSLRSVGYRQLWSYLSNQVSLEEARSASLSATRQVAKRQLTWLKSFRNLKWIYTNDDGTLHSSKNKSMPADPIDLIQSSIAYYTG